MAEFVGQTNYLKFGSTVLSADFRNFDADEDIGIVDASAGADLNRSYLTTVKDGKASAELLAQTAGSVLWAAVVPGTYGTLEWGPEGTATGKPKHSAVAVVTNRKKVVPYDNLVVLNIEFQLSGAVTDAAY